MNKFEFKDSVKLKGWAMAADLVLHLLPYSVGRLTTRNFQVLSQYSRLDWHIANDKENGEGHLVVLLVGVLLTGMVDFCNIHINTTTSREDLCLYRLTATDLCLHLIL